MNSLVLCESVPLNKRLAALFAFVGLLPSVLPDVNVQVADVGALIVALWARIRLCFGMRSLMRCEVAFRQACFATNVAFKTTVV